MKDRRQVRIIMHNHTRKFHNEDGAPQYYRTENALELKSQTALNTYAANGITYKNNILYQPQENSLTERINQTLINAARANLHHAKLPTPYWEDAVRDTAFTYNIIPHSTTGKPPYTQWHGQSIETCRLLTFGEISTISCNPNKNLTPEAHHYDTCTETMTTRSQCKRSTQRDTEQYAQRIYDRTHGTTTHATAQRPQSNQRQSNTP